MSITSITVPAEECAEDGLKPIQMHRLNRLVALAGKNGSGKTRLLELVERYVIDRSNGLAKLESNKASLVSWRRALETNPDSTSAQAWRDAIERANKEIIAAQDRVQGIGEFRALRFVPKKLQIHDPTQFSKADLIRRYRDAMSITVDSYADHVLAYIQHSQNKYWEVRHQDYSGDNTKRDSIAEDYEALRDILESLLGTSLGRSEDGDALLFGKPIAQAKLSDGQIVILQLAVAIHAQKASLDNTVFLLDELENHLHPSAVIDLLNRIQQAAPTSQIWIATHSIPLLAHVASLDPMAIWYMESGLVTHAGRHPERVLQSLLGNEEQIGALHNFTGLPWALAAVNYAAESMLPPAVATNGTNDEQVKQIHRVMQRLATNRSLRVLDYGAGKGRLLEGLAYEESGSSLKDRISYFAIDDSPKNEETCKAIIAEHFGSESVRYFRSSEEFFSEKDNGSIDVVVMCNVLHEIPPNDWISVFAEGGLVRRSLSENGYLMVVEDQRIPTGEKAHEHGFLVLDTAQLKSLFDITEQDIQQEKFLRDDHRSDGRLKCHLIARSLLGRLTAQTRDRAINELGENALENIRRVRGLSYSYAAGQEHGFWTQQFANSRIFLKQNGA